MVSPEVIPDKTFRIVDASLNRAAEGLRYLEDVARFMLNSQSLTQSLKTIRHDLVISEWNFQKQLLISRNSGGDVGVDIEVPADKEQPRDLPSSIVANSRRVQEALRTLEELAKVSSLTPKLTTEKIQKFRFELYRLEKEIIGTLLRQDKAKGISGLYVVIDTLALKGCSHVEIALPVIRGGARIIQLRDKTMDRGALLPIARELKDLCAWSNALFIINDYLDVALAVQADGLHLGQTDMPISVARQLVPMDMMLGCSVTSVEMALRAQADGADYVAVSAVYPTPSKAGVTAVGIDVLQQVKQAVAVPVVAIGGIDSGKLHELKATGVDAIAVISAVLGADSPEAATRQMIQNFEVNNG